MKKAVKFLVYIIFTGLTCLSTNAQNPTGTCTVLHQPCNFDGVVVTTITSGMTPPLTFNYRDNYNTTHSNVNALSDTLSGRSVCYKNI